MAHRHIVLQPKQVLTHRPDSQRTTNLLSSGTGTTGLYMPETNKHEPPITKDLLANPVERVRQQAD
jgi:hypothetical protein